MAWGLTFTDALTSAYAAALYVAWRNDEKRLLIAKSRVTPLRGTSTPRAELQALVIMMRLLEEVTSAASFKIQRIITLADSEIVPASVGKSGSQMGPSFTNRISEIAALQEDIAKRAEIMEPLAWVPTDQNPVDIATRGSVRAQDMGPGSVWQERPSFLIQERDIWPIRSTTNASPPPEEMRKRHKVRVPVETN